MKKKKQPTLASVTAEYKKEDLKDLNLLQNTIWQASRPQKNTRSDKKYFFLKIKN